MNNMVWLRSLEINKYMRYFQIDIKAYVEDIPQLPDAKDNDDQLKIEDNNDENKKKQDKLMMPSNATKQFVMKPTIASKSEIIRSSMDIKSMVIETPEFEGPELCNSSIDNVVKSNNGGIKSKNASMRGCKGIKGINKVTKFGVIKSNSKMIKPGIAKKSELAATNRFTLLNEEPCLINISTEESYGMFMIGKLNIFHVRKVRKVSGESEKDLNITQTSRIMCKKNYLKKFETENRFNVLRGNDEMELEKIIRVDKILCTVKKSLKRCKKCHFKKRSCLLNPSSCQASQRLCHKCKKIGHFPRSINCKVNTKLLSSSIPKSSPRTYELPKQWKKDVLLLVTNRINLLRRLAKEKETRRVVDQDMKQLIANELIPYLLMYITFNPDLSLPVIKKGNKKKLEKDAIMKEAKACAKKFCKEGQKLNRWNFVKYCHKKFNKLLLNANNEDVNYNSVFSILKAFDQIFYKDANVHYLCEESTTNELQDSSPKIHVSSYEDYNNIPNETLVHSNHANCNQPEDANGRVKLFGGGKVVVNYENMNFDEHSSVNRIHMQDYIPQIDGLDDPARKVEKKIFGINCEIKGIVQLINFFRSFNFLWISSCLKSHWMCPLNQQCFFCYMRSSCLRLRKERSKGPRMIQLNEFANQLYQYNSILGWNWMENESDLPTFIENTLRLIHKRENLCAHFKMGDKDCQECEKEEECFISKVNNKKLVKAEKAIKIGELIEDVVLKRNMNKKCSHYSITAEKECCVIIQVSEPAEINVSDGEIYRGIRISYRAHAELQVDSQYQVFFRYNNQMYTQDDNGSINQAYFGVHNNVTMISIYISNQKGTNVVENVDEFIYGKHEQLKLRQQYQKFISPKKYEMKQAQRKEYFKDIDKLPERLNMKRQHDQVRDQLPERKAKKSEYDQVRDQLPERKAKKSEYDKVRDQLPERKAKKSEYDQVRDKLPERKEMKSQHDQLPERKAKKRLKDKVRDKIPNRKEKRSLYDQGRDKLPERKAKKAIHDKTSKRKEMNREIKKKNYRRDQLNQYEASETKRIQRNIKNKQKYQKLLRSSLATDTGFDLLCSCCLQYKSKDFCKPVKCLNEEQISKFIIDFCYILKSRTEGQFVCYPCLKDIKRDKTPKRSHINKFKFANYPRSFILKLKQICNFKECQTSKKYQEGQENYERKILKLNKLEAYLLKLVIPFIRIAHCPRGPYLKVKGDLILISSDIDHSLSKILPSEQGLIPVCFKRKLSYGGSYLEEYVEKNKVKMYFSWLKKHNHLFKDIELD